MAVGKYRQIILCIIYLHIGFDGIHSSHENKEHNKEHNISVAGYPGGNTTLVKKLYS